MPHESDSASLSLERSAAYADLLDWCKSTRSVAQTVKGLRTKLAGTFDSGYVSIFSRLDFKRRNDGTKSAAHTGESMGKMVEAAAQSSAGEIPEVILFRVKLFAGMAISEHDLRFAVTVDPNAETISIAPVGDCIQDAHQATRVELLTRLKKEFPESLDVHAMNSHNHGRIRPTFSLFGCKTNTALPLAFREERTPETTSRINECQSSSVHRP